MFCDISRHKLSKKFVFLENRIVASTQDMKERLRMKRRGYRIDKSEGVQPPTPTREELKKEYADTGIQVKFGLAINGYNGRNNLNRHQYVGVYVPK